MNSQIDSQLINAMVDTLVSIVTPQQVILFGSYGRNTAGPNSDVDFLVVTEEPFGPHRSRRKEATKVWRALAKFGVPTDILMYSANEVDQWRHSPNHVIAKALQEGQIVYERPAAS